jgi:hypothetical protein
VTSIFTPVQNRYFDPYQQLINSGTSGTSGLMQINTAYPKKYLSRVSNQQFLKVIGNNIILKDLNITPAYAGPVAFASISSGTVIQDDTLISILPVTLDLNCSTYGDTPLTGSHLCVFSNFKYIETPDVDSQTPLVLTLYHVDSTGYVVSGSPTFDLTRNLILVGILDFTKASTNMASISISTLTEITVMGKSFTVGGGFENMMIYSVFDALAGVSGTSGVSGISKTSGTAGTVGTTGSSGLSKSSGSSGTAASSGNLGSQGTTGTHGTSSTSLILAMSGTSSTSGLSRSSGSSGLSKSSGSSGSSGLSKSSGSSGVKGSAGTSNSRGTAGTAGSAGITRSSGSSGTSGTSGPDVTINDAIEIVFLNI